MNLVEMCLVCYMSNRVKGGPVSVTVTILTTDITTEHFRLEGKSYVGGCANCGHPLIEIDPLGGSPEELVDDSI